MEKRISFKDYKRVVIKIGTTSLTYPNGKLNLKRIEKLSWILTDLKNQGREVILVSSGAIAVGADRLGLQERPRDTIGKQAASAVGQAILMQIYEKFFTDYNQKIAQILLTKDIIEVEERRTNARNTFSKLLELGVIPIVNENDTISTEELEFSDNDTLSAYVSCVVSADLLIILSDIDGLYDSDPKKNPDAKMIHEVAAVTADVKNKAGGSQSTLGTGGMITKICAAEICGNEKIDTVIAQGENPDILYDILEGYEVGTIFLS